jgi:hypothetical protein
MNSNNNSLMVVASLAGTLVACGGLYLQWLDHNVKERATTELSQPVNHRADLSAEVTAPVALPPEQISAVSVPVQAAMTTATAKVHVKDMPPARATKSGADNDLALPPPAAEFDKIDTLDVDKTGL